MLSHNTLPVLFLSHGGGPAHALDFGSSPFSVIDKNSKSASFLRNLPKTLEKYTSLSVIRCILVVTAHWEEKEFTVDYQTGPETKLVYDYYGFPRESYAPYLTYPVPTDLAIADRIFNLLRSHGLPAAKKDRGFDHGTFMPLKIAFPEARIPVVQLSLKSNLDARDHFRLGEILRPLRKEGVLIIGSGQITHNLGAFGDPDSIDTRTKQFTDFIYNQLTSIRSTSDYDNLKKLFAEETNKIPFYAFSHPRAEHFVPLYVAMAAGVNEIDQVIPTNEVSPSGTTISSETTEKKILEANRIYSEIVMGSMSIDSYLFQ